MKMRFMVATLLVLLMSLAVFVPISASAATSHTSSHTSANATASPFKNIPVTGTVTKPAGKTVATFKGTMNVQRFTARNGRLFAVGTVSGTLLNSAGHVMGTVTNVPIAIPVAAAATCQILTLTLGPLDLNLLGLKVHLDRVVLTITAQQGPGNLLGNLLCAIANLLNTGGPLSQLVSLLNQVIALLP